MKEFFSKLNIFKKTKQANKSIKKTSRPIQKPVIKKTESRFKRAIVVFGLILFCSLVLTLSLRGMAGNPTPEELNTTHWKNNGPLELSPERGRYALLYSLVEHKSFTFTPDIAAFSAPDVGYHNGQYVSLFAPGISFLIMPGYYLGKLAGLAQVGSFAVITLFALCNFFLIRTIAIRLGATHPAATIGAAAFLFASPAFTYAVTLYQHHVSTFLILLSIFLLMRFNSFFSLLAIWIMCGISVVIDYPNFFMMLPIGLYALGRTIFVERKEQIMRLSISLIRVLAIGAIAIPLTFFLWFNSISYGNPLTLSGSVERAIEVKPNGQPLLESEKAKQELKASGHDKAVVEEKNVGAFFHPRNLMAGFYTHFISLDRGILFYTPVMLFGAAGILFSRKRNYLSLFAAVIGFNIILYSMWGDPYGGWAFGSRYLIPTYAILGIFIAVVLTKLRKYVLFLLMFFMLFCYSVGVNTLGAITSSTNPPQIEAAALERSSGIAQPYTYERNMHLLDKGISKSYVYQTYLKDYMSAWQFYSLISGFIIGIGAVMLIVLAAPAMSKKQAIPSVRVKTAVLPNRKESYAV